MRNSSSHYAFLRVIYLLLFAAISVSPLRATIMTTATVNVGSLNSEQYDCSTQGGSNANCDLRIPRSSTVGGEFQASASSSYGSVSASTRVVAYSYPFISPIAGASATAFFEDTLLLTGNSGEAYLQVVFRNQGTSFDGSFSGFLEVATSSLTARRSFCIFGCMFSDFDGLNIPLSFGEPVRISLMARSSAVTGLADGAGTSGISSSIVAIYLLGQRPRCP